MTETNAETNAETNEEQRTPGFQRALVGKLIAAGIFVALGTVAVFYSIRACQDCEPTDDGADKVAAIDDQDDVEPAAEPEGVVKQAGGLQIQPVSTAGKTTLPPITSPSKMQSPGQASTAAERQTSLTRDANTGAGTASNNGFKANQLTPNRVTTQRPPSKTFVPPKQSDSSGDNSFGGGQKMASPKPLHLPKKNIVGGAKQSVSNGFQQLKNKTNDLTKSAIDNTKSTTNNLADKTGNALRSLNNRAGQFKNNLLGNAATNNAATNNANALPAKASIGDSTNQIGSGSFDKSKTLQPFNSKPRNLNQEFNSNPITSKATNPNPVNAKPINPNPSVNSGIAGGSTTRPPINPSVGQVRQTAPIKQASPIRQPFNANNPPVSTRQGMTRPASPNLTKMTRSTPGDRKLEGVQSPSLTLERIAPTEIQVNQPADFQFVVKNVGRATANNVQIYDEIPEGTELIQAVPQPSRGAGRQISWSLDTLAPGQEKRIKMQLRPTQPGEIGSVAQFSFSTQASMRTKVTQPKLAIRHSTKPRVLIGDPVILDIDVRNEGDGPARDVVIQEDLPEGLEFSEGFRELEYAIGTLGPGQSKKVALELKAAKIGRYRNLLVAHGSGGLQSQHALDLEVIAPKLVARGEGPTRRFLNREVTHNFSVNNSGTANATNVELVCKLPTGLRYVSANNRGQYDENTHSVYWSLAELNAGLVANVDVTTVPTEPGNQDLTFEASADLGQSADAICKLSVEHLVDVFFDIDDMVDPIEIGSSTAYKLRIVNQGTKTATNIQLSVEFPRGIQPTGVEGNITNEIRGQMIAFSPITSMNPGDEIEITLKGKGISPGDHRVVVNLITDGREVNVSKQESTRVYSDR